MKLLYIFISVVILFTFVACSENLPASDVASNVDDIDKVSDKVEGDKLNVESNQDEKVSSSADTVELRITEVDKLLYLTPDEISSLFGEPIWKEELSDGLRAQYGEGTNVTAYVAYQKNGDELTAIDLSIYTPDFTLYGLKVSNNYTDLINTLGYGSSTSYGNGFNSNTGELIPLEDLIIEVGYYFEESDIYYEFTVNQSSGVIKEIMVIDNDFYKEAIINPILNSSIVGIWRTNETGEYMEFTDSGRFIMYSSDTTPVMAGSYSIIDNLITMNALSDANLDSEGKAFRFIFSYEFSVKGTSLSLQPNFAYSFPNNHVGNLSNFTEEVAYNLTYFSESQVTPKENAYLSGSTVPEAADNNETSSSETSSAANTPASSSNELGDYLQALLVSEYPGFIVTTPKISIIDYRGEALQGYQVSATDMDTTHNYFISKSEEIFYLDTNDLDNAIANGGSFWVKIQ